MSNLIRGYHNQVFEHYYQQSYAPPYFHRQFDQSLPQTIFGSERISQ